MDLLNLLGINYEDAIIDTIEEVEEEYKGLTKDQTCFIYSGLVYEKLRKKHILCRIINTTLDLNNDYEHEFVLVKENDYYYVIDLTYKQFFKEVPEAFSQLDKEGYQKVNKRMLKEYLKTIMREPVKQNIDSLFF